MLRGWVSIWTTQMLWFFATMTLTVGATAVAELCSPGLLRVLAARRNANRPELREHPLD